jgi:hypothetical protein
MVSPWSLGSVASGFVPGKAEHQDGELVVEQSGSPHGGQEAEREREPTLMGSSPFPPIIPSAPPAYWMVVTTFRESLSLLVTSLQEHSCRHS